MMAFACNKRGNAVLDTLTVLLFLTVFVFFIIFGYDAYEDINTDIQSDDTLGNTSKEMVEDFGEMYISVFDAGFITVMVLLWILVIVASFMVDSHPVFMIVTVVLLIFVFVLAVTLGNTYEEIMTENFADITPKFPMTHWIMTHFLTVAIVIGFSIIIAMYAKSRL